jgi:hypothetical protein
MSLNPALFPQIIGMPLMAGSSDPTLQGRPGHFGGPNWMLEDLTSMVRVLDFILYCIYQRVRLNCNSGNWHYCKQKKNIYAIWRLASLDIFFQASPKFFCQDLRLDTYYSANFTNYTNYIHYSHYYVH